MIKITDKPVVDSTAEGDKLLLNRGGAVKQIPRDVLMKDIEQDISNLEKDISAVAQTSAEGIVVTATGSAIAIKDSSNKPLKNLIVYGSTTQNGTPTPEAPVDLVSVENPTVTITDGEEKTQTFSVPYTLNGVGDVKDYVDFERGFLVRNCAIINSFVFRKYSAVDSTFVADVPFSAKAYIGLCNRYPRYDGSVDTMPDKTFRKTAAQQIYIHDTDYKTANEINSAYANGELMVLGVLATPIENPLTAEELEAFKQLTTYKPITTITNSEGAEMSVEYVADTKNYIDQKLASLVASATTSEV